MAYIKKKKFRMNCTFQEWKGIDDENLLKGILKVPKVIWEDLMDEERPGKVICILKEKDCIRSICPLFLIFKKVERIELKVDKLKLKVKNKRKTNRDDKIK